MATSNVTNQNQLSDSMLSLLNGTKSASGTGSSGSTSSSGSSSTTGTNAANKNEFITLMVAQLKNQDPLSPQDGTAFLSQLAQFSQVDGIQQLNTTMSDMSKSYRSSQALQASALVGRNVQVPSAVGSLAKSGPLKGTVTIPDGAGDVIMNITAPNGTPIRKLDLGQHKAGDFDFSWDGITDAGVRAPAGNYSISVSAPINGKATALQTYTGINVDSVTIDKQGAVSLNVANGGTVSLDQVKQID